MDLQSQLKTAVQIASEAGEIGLSYFRSDEVGTRAKGVGDVITAADTASEDLVLRRLADVFPADGVIGEEGTRVDGTGTRRWLVDPLDGTLNYSRGLPIWAVSLALFDGDQPLLGVVHDPLRGESFYAARSLGAWRNDTPIRCSDVVDVSSALLHLTVDFHKGSLQDSLDDLRALAPRVLRTRNIGSAALALAYVAAGYFDAMLHRFAHPWDYGAGVLLVQEAGGTVTDIDGGPYQLGTSALLAACGDRLHGPLLDVIQGRPRSNVE